MIKVVVIGIIGAVLSAMLKRINSNLSFVAALATGVTIILLVYVDMESLTDVVATFSGGFGVQDGHVKLLVKVLGISFITQFGTGAAEECGEKFIAQKIEFAGRVLIITLSVPIMISLLDTILNII